MSIRYGVRGAASLAAAALVAALMLDGSRVLAALIVAWAWALGIALGALFLDCILACCGARWQLPLLRLLEAMHGLVAWLAGAALVALMLVSILRHGNRGGDAWPGIATLLWLVPAVALSTLLRWMSRRLELGTPAVWSHRRHALACAATLPVGLSVALGVMAGYRLIDPFSSSLFGVLMAVHGLLAAMAWWALAVARLEHQRRLPIHRDHLVALGRLLLTLVIVAAYLAFSQLIICWMGDLPGEASWYGPRLHGYLGWLGLSVLVLGFALPLVILLPHATKQRPWALGTVAAIILLSQALDTWWTVMPALRGSAVRLAWADAAAAAAAIAAIAWRLARPRSATLPSHDPGLSAGLAYRERLA